MTEARAQIIIVAGSRTWTDPEPIYRQLDAYRAHGPLEIWTGGARGADRIAQIWANLRHVPQVTWLPDWQTYGRSAGIVRSRAMIEAAPTSTIVLAYAPFPLSASRGTAHTVELAKARRLFAYLTDADGQCRCVSTPRGGITR